MVMRFARHSCDASLIPVLVTGIQPRRVCAVKGGVAFRSSAPKDLGALDSCDILGLDPGNRNEERKLALSVPNVEAHP